MPGLEFRRPGTSRAMLLFFRSFLVSHQGIEPQTSSNGLKVIRCIARLGLPRQGIEPQVFYYRLDGPDVFTSPNRDVNIGFEVSKMTAYMRYEMLFLGACLSRLSLDRETFIMVDIPDRSRSRMWIPGGDWPQAAVAP